MPSLAPNSICDICFELFDQHLRRACTSTSGCGHVFCLEYVTIRLWIRYPDVYTLHLAVIVTLGGNKEDVLLAETIWAPRSSFTLM